MPTASKVFIEAIVVGFVFLALFLAVHSVDMSLRKGKSMTHEGMVLQAFVAGLLGHLIFEITSVNKWYAKQYK